MWLLAPFFILASGPLGSWLLSAIDPISSFYRFPGNNALPAGAPHI
jgi:hypothetical protein